jgi:hypothetical protein
MKTIEHPSTRFRTLVLALLTATAMVAHAQTDWVWRNPLPQGNDLRAVAHGNNRYVVVGLAGAVVISGDGVTWTNNPNAGTNDLTGVAFGAGVFVAVGKGGVIFTSPNGQAWSAHPSATVNDLNGVTYGAGLFAAVGNSGVMLVSGDGASWGALDSGTTANLRAVASDDMLTFIAVGDNGVVTRADDGGYTWSATTINGSYFIYGINFASCGKFIAAGYNSVAGQRAGLILTLESGTVWVSRSSNTDSWLYGVNSDPASGAVVILGNAGAVLNSYDCGGTWTSVNSNTSEDLAGTCRGVDLFVAVGKKGVLLNSGSGWTWSLQTAGAFTDLKSAIWSGSNAVIVGAMGRVIISTNDYAGTAQPSGVTDDLLGLAIGTGKFVAVGTAGRILTSTDATAWTPQASGVSNDLAAVAGTPNLLVAVGTAGRILTSTNGIDWTNPNSGVTLNLSGVTYGGGLFVAVGASGKILTSYDGTNWASQTSGVATPLNSVTYGDGRFVVVGKIGKILTSITGTNWIAPASGTTRELRGVCYGGVQASNLMRFVAVGANGTVLTSPDGLAWTTQYSGVSGTLETVGYGNNQFLAAGAGGAIISSWLEGCFPPFIYSDSTVAAGTCSNFTYQILAGYNPAWFGASGLPGGLSVNPASGLISGFPDVGGSFEITMLASNQCGVSTQHLVLSLIQSNQTVAFNSIPPQHVCNPPVTVSASASSGLPVILDVVSGPGLMTNGNQVAWTDTGTICVRAAQPGNACYLAAIPVTNCFTISLEEQTIFFATITNRYLCDPPANLSATASSGLPVIFDVVSGLGLIANGNQVTWTNTGTLCVRATQQGDSCYTPAPSVTNCFTISLRPQTITFAGMTTSYLCDPPLTLTATASSGLPVSFSVVSGPATIIGNQLHWLSTGSATIRASQAGNQCYAAAASVDRSFSPSLNPQTITFTAPATALQRKPFLLQATANSGLPVTFSVVSGPALVVGNLCVATNQGSLTIRASQAGSRCFLQAADVLQSVTVNAYTPLSTLPGEPAIRAIAYGAGKFVTVGVSNIYASQDGLAWVTVQHKSGGTDVVYGGDKFVANDDQGNMYSSSDGMVWAVAHVGYQHSGGLTYGSGKFVSAMPYNQGGLSAASTDGTHWTFGSAIDYSLGRVTYGNGRFLAIGTIFSQYVWFNFLYSIDGLNWTISGPDLITRNDLCFAYNRFISVGASGNGTAGIFTSADGINWVSVLSSGQILLGISYAGGRLVAGGEAGRIVASSDGTNWIEQTGVSDPSYDVYNSAYGNKRCIIVGNKSSGSTFLVSYPPVPIPTFAAGTNLVGLVGSPFSYQVIAGNSPVLYAAVGLPPGLEINATNGLISGTPMVAGNYALTLAAANAGGIGTKGLTLTITSPIQCPTVLSQPQNQTVVVGENASLAVTVAGDLPLIYQWLKNGTNLANGGRISGATSNVLTFANVLTNDTGTYSLLVTNACGTATSSNAVLTVSVSPPQFVVGSARSSGGQFSFTLQSQPGLSFEIQASTNLVNWATVATLTNSSGTIPFTTPTAGFTRRFYRARQLP